MALETFESTLSGGHPNSLGNTLDVVTDVLADKSLLQDLYDCYQSDDEVVRLRVSSCMKRVCQAEPTWVAEYLDGLIAEISKIDQPSTKWTLAILFTLLDDNMNKTQRAAAVAIMKTNLNEDKDWIVQNTTLASLYYFAQNDKPLMSWFAPQLKTAQKNSHKSVRSKATKILAEIEKNNTEK